MKNITKNLTAGCLLATLICQQALGSDTGSCGDNCVYTFENGTLTYSVADPNSNNGKGEISISNALFGITGTVGNVIIKEGITSSIVTNWNYSAIMNVGTSNGKLVIPDNFNAGGSSFSGLGFGTVEIGNNVKMGAWTLRCQSSATPTIVMDPNNSITINPSVFEHGVPSGLNIACKGNPDACLEKFGNSLNYITGTINAGYYRGLNSDGNYEVWSENGLAVYNNAKMEELIAKYDTNGNLRYISNTDGSSFTYDADGKLIGAKKTSPFTPAEAAALIKKGNVNKVSLTFK